MANNQLRLRFSEEKIDISTGLVLVSNYTHQHAAVPLALFELLLEVFELVPTTQKCLTTL